MGLEVQSCSVDVKLVWSMYIVLTVELDVEVVVVVLVVFPIPMD